MKQSQKQVKPDLPAASPRIDLQDLPTYKDAQYSDIGLNDLLACAVSRLNALGHRATFENIVVCAYKLFPSKFSLISYPEFPDAARVNRVILHLGPKYVGWLVGKNKMGYALNQRGIEAAQRTLTNLRSESSISEKEKSSKQLVQDNIAGRTVPETRLNRIKETNSYKSWIKGLTSQISDEVLMWDTLQLFITADDLTKAEVYGGLVQIARNHDDREVLQFLLWIKKQRPYLIGETTKPKRR